MGWLVAAGLVGACLALVLLPRRPVQGSALALLRCFFPSWRFFEEIEPGPTLSVSSASSGGEFGPWRDALEPAPRSAGAIVLNARGNLHLAYHSLVEQLWSEIEEDPDVDVTQLVTYQLVARLVQVEVLNPAERSPSARFRFRLTPGGSDQHAFESAVHGLE